MKQQNIAVMFMVGQYFFLSLQNLITSVDVRAR